MTVDAAGAAGSGGLVDEGAARSSRQCVPGAAFDDGPSPSAPDHAIEIHDLQGPDHVSPLAGTEVSGVAGIVTALTKDGFALQSMRPDADLGSSEGIFVELSSESTVEVGDAVTVSGEVSEVGSWPGLTVTKIVNASTSVVSKQHALPEPILIGDGGRCPPTEVIHGSAFDPVLHGLDFYESLEGMRVAIEDPVVTGATNGYGEIVVLPNRGGWATHRNARGGVYVAADDFNPERVLVDDFLVGRAPATAVGDRFTSPITGVFGYGYGNFRLLSTESLPPLLRPSVEPASARLVGDDRHLTIAALNVQNLEPGDTERLAAFGILIAQTLGSPDAVVLQEIQDGNGPAYGVLTADLTYEALARAIVDAGGPSYDWRDVPPSAEDADGGEPGGNIRVGLVFNPARVTFVDRGSAGPMDPTRAVLTESGLALSHSPGRLAPSDPAWTGSRKPLALELELEGRRLIVIGCHLKSKSGDGGLFEAEQPPPTPSSDQRLAQAEVVARTVESWLLLDPDVHLVVVGDLNDFDFSPTLRVLTRSLTSLTEGIDLEDRYSYVYDGNAQLLDHVLVSAGLADGSSAEILHAFAGSAPGRPTDHDPVLARLRLAP